MTATFTSVHISSVNEGDEVAVQDWTNKTSGVAECSLVKLPEARKGRLTRTMKVARIEQAGVHSHRNAGKVFIIGADGTKVATTLRSKVTVQG